VIPHTRYYLLLHVCTYFSYLCCIYTHSAGSPTFIKAGKEFFIRRKGAVSGIDEKEFLVYILSIRLRFGAVSHNISFWVLHIGER
jgi:hypothetical protein